MPDYGRLTQELLPHASPAVAPLYPPPPWPLPGARILKLLFETDTGPLPPLPAPPAGPPSPPPAPPPPPPPPPPTPPRRLGHPPPPETPRVRRERGGQVARARV